MILTVMIFTDKVLPSPDSTVVNGYFDVTCDTSTPPPAEPVLLDVIVVGSGGKKYILSHRQS